MNHIDVTCGACGTVSEAPLEMAGQVAQCPACSVEMRVPALPPQPTAPSRPAKAASPIRLVALCALLVVAVALVMCYFQGIFTPHRDPLSDFKEIASGVSAYRFSIDGKVITQSSDVEYDVQKTESIVSPFMATLTYVELNSYGTFKYTLAFAWQEETWVFKSGTKVGTGSLFGGTVTQIESYKDLPVALTSVLRNISYERTR